MSKHLIVILLFVSLAFNLAVLGMFMYTSIYHKPLFYPPRWEDNQRNRDREQGFHNIRHGRNWPDSLLKNREEIKQLRLTFSQSRREFMQEMRNDKFDLNKANAALQKSLQAQAKLEKRLGESLIELRKTMSPEQAKRFFLEHRDRTNRVYRQKPRRDGQTASPDNTLPQGDKR